MHGVAKVLALGATIVTIAACVSAPANGQSDTTHRWRFNITPYGWVSELNGRVGVGPVTSSVNLSPNDILNSLKFGAMAYSEARYGPYMISADGIYASFGQGHVFAVRGDTGTLDLTQSETMIQPMAGYTFGAYGWGFDVMGGARYWKLNAAIDVDGPLRPSNRRSQARDWLDAIAGVRARWMPLERVRFVVDADAGGGGSKGTWQLYSSVGYDIVSDVTLGLTYRALSVDYDRDNFLFDTNTQGFAFGLSFRFP